jgi:hypothetical protein
MQDFTNILANFGFPVAVAAFLLFSFQKKLENLTDEVKRRNVLLDKLTEKVNELNYKINRHVDN